MALWNTVTLEYYVNYSKKKSESGEKLTQYNKKMTRADILKGWKQWG